MEWRCISQYCSASGQTRIVLLLPFCCVLKLPTMSNMQCVNDSIHWSLVLKNINSKKTTTNKKSLHYEFRERFTWTTASDS